MATILLTGASGNVSRATIEALKGSGHRLIGLVRDVAKAPGLKEQGLEVRVGDLSRPRSLEGAFAGVDTAWLLVSAGAAAPYLASNALWAAREAGVKHVVRMSAVGAAHAAPTLNSRMHALSDSDVAGSGGSFTILKPHFFMQNLMMAAKAVAEQGTLTFALGNAALPMIDVRDIGAVAAKVLSEPKPHVGKTYTLTGSVRVTLEQVAAALGAALDKPVKYVAVPVAAQVETLARFGADDYAQVSIRDYFTAYSQGWQAEVTPELERILGRPARTIADFAKDNAAAFGRR